MELTHLVVSVGELVRAPAPEPGPVVVSVSDGDVVVALAGRDRGLGPLGPWLEVGPDYPASMAARDVATLSWVVDVDHVVIAGERAAQQAAVVRALLSDDEVTVVNDVATVRGAYNRPAPPRPITVWHASDDVVTDGVRVLRVTPSTGPATRYRD